MAKPVQLPLDASSDYEANPVPSYVGWWQPHKPVNWTGEIVDPKTGELVKEPSLTKQDQADACDINRIVRQYNATGVYSHVNERAAQGMYADLSSAPDYQDALNIIARANEAFESLPASVRERFMNDPARFLDFMGDPVNQDEAIRLGLATLREEPVEPPPQRVEIVNPKPTGGEGGSPPSGGAKAP